MVLGDLNAGAGSRPLRVLLGDDLLADAWSRAAVRRTPLHDTTTWEALQRRWSRFVEVLHHHHTVEDEAFYFYYAALPIIVAGMWFAWRVVHSPFGRVLQAIRENEFRAEALGYRTVVYRIWANCLAALVAASE